MYRKDSTAWTLWKQWVDVKTTMAFNAMSAVKSAIDSAKFGIVIYPDGNSPLIKLPSFPKWELRMKLMEDYVERFYVVYQRGKVDKYIYDSSHAVVYCKDCDNCLDFKHAFANKENMFYCELCGCPELSSIPKDLMDESE